jgi:Polyketide cyclase / dehydrase and lipid transport
MFRFHGSLSMDAPVETIWRRLIDFPAIPTWEGGVLEVRQVSAGSPGVGTELVARRVYGGRESTVDCRVTDWDEGRGATMSIRGGPIEYASVRYAVEPAADGRPLVTYSARGEFRGAWRLLTPLAGLMGANQVRSNLERLRRQVEPPAVRAASD